MATSYTGSYCIRCGHRQERQHKDQACVGFVNGQRCNSIGFTPVLAHVPWSMLMRGVDKKFLRELRISHE